MRSNAPLAPKTSVDARGLRCPLPVLKARKALKELPKGALLELIADDPASIIDVPHFCAEQGLRLALSEERADGAMCYLIEKPSP